MMDRLISESELIDIIQGSEKLLEHQKTEYIECIRACDTAYDKDEVIKQLKTKIEIIPRQAPSLCYLLKLYANLVLDRAIKIVESGGRNGN